MTGFKKYWPYLIIIAGLFFSVVAAYVSIKSTGSSRATSTPSTISRATKETTQKSAGLSFFEAIRRLTDFSSLVPRVPTATLPGGGATSGDGSGSAQKVVELPEWASLLYGKIRIGSSYTRSSDPRTEYVTIYAPRENRESVLISGLRLESAATGEGANIGDGVYLDFQKQPSIKQPIFLRPGGVAYVVTGKSLFGFSFQVNKCSGYLEQYHNFYPAISTRCPLFNSIELPRKPNQLNDACLDFLDTLSICTEYATFPRNITHECQNFIKERLNYGACVDRYKNDTDFYSGGWRVYLERDQELWKSKRERIELRDRNGKFIDALVY